MTSPTHVVRRPLRSVRSVFTLALLGALAIVAVGATRAAQDTQRVTRLELVDGEGRVTMVVDVSRSGRPRISVVDGDDAALFELSATEIQIIAPGQGAAEGEEPQMAVSRIRFDALQALAGAVAANPDANTPADSLAIRMQYLQEQIDTLRGEQRDERLERERNEPRGRDTSDPLRLQRVIDELQRQVRDLENNVRDATRENDDLERRVRTIEAKIRE